MPPETGRRRRGSSRDRPPPVPRGGGSGRGDARVGHGRHT